MALIYEDILSLTIDTEIFFIRMINSQQTFLPDKEIFLSVGDDGLPIVELVESPMIKN